MASITVWIFDSAGEAHVHAQKETSDGRKVIGPTQLGSVDVIKRSGGTPTDKFFKKFDGKWGIAVLT